MVDTERALELYREGVERRVSGNLEAAIRCQRAALQAAPNLAAAHYDLGLTYRLLGRFEEAAACQMEAIRLQPDLAAAHLDLAYVRRAQRRIAEAQASFLEALRLQPDLKDAAVALATIADLPLVFRALERFKSSPDRSPAHQGLLGRLVDRLRGRNAPEAYFTVQGGIFAGLKFPEDCHWEFLLPRLVGSYEQELVPIFRSVIERRFKRVVDVGACDGYYVVGLARLMPQAEVFGFDISPQAQRWMQGTVALNGVENVMVGGYCGPDDLSRLCGPETFLLLDCEGCERELLDPSATPELRDTTILAEVHDHYVVGTTDALIKRFSATHRISFYRPSLRDPDDYPCLAAFPEEERRVAMLERNEYVHWMYFEPTS